MDNNCILNIISFQDISICVFGVFPVTLMLVVTSIYFTSVHVCLSVFETIEKSIPRPVCSILNIKMITHAQNI